MFRQMRRFKQQLSEEECLQILLDGKDGVLAVHGDDGYPYAVPLNYVYLDGCIYIHCAKSGHKLDAIKKDARVSFCVVAENGILQQKYTTLYKSVIVFGKAEIAGGNDEMYTSVKALAEKYCPEAAGGIESEIEREWDMLCIVKITPEHITGKQCKEFLKETGPNESNIEIIKQTEPNQCGGTNATLDRSAPNQINSQEMVLFDVTSSFFGVFVPDDDGTKEKLSFVSAFAVPAQGGTFLFFEKKTGYSTDDPFYSSFALIKEDIFPSLVKLVTDYDLAKRNGYHSTTQGLPQNFGGRADIHYSSGERISFSDNQTPIIPLDAARKISEIFTDALSGEKIALPDSSAVREIRFTENRENNCFTKAVLTLKPDGTAINKKASCYDGENVYESEKDVDADTVCEIRRIIDNCGIFAWEDLPESEYCFGSEKSLSFVLDGGTQITVSNKKALPLKLGNGFFSIELEMATKN